FWAPKNGQMIQIVPEEKTVTLKMNFMTRPVTLRKPITISFGLMPSPVRPPASRRTSGKPLRRGEGPYVENNPFALYPGGEEYGSIAFAEYLIYPMPKKLSPQQGTLEFWFRRTDKSPQ